MRHAMIMAGGSGTRLWPLSRVGRPKQLIRFVNGQSLLEIALARIATLVEPDHRWICTNESFRELITVELGFPDERVLGEPMGRDTLNAIGLSAAVIARLDPDATMAVLTADHLIQPVDRFATALRTGFEIAERWPEALVTFSIVPDHPATGFGYIERGERLSNEHGEAYRVVRYVEKPDLETARRFIESSAFGWSSGMFVFSAQGILDAIARFVPEAIVGLTEIADAWGTDHQWETLRRVYPSLPKISIDYAVMQPASRDDRTLVAAVPMDVSWLDVGSWPALARTLEADTEGNRTLGRTLVHHGRNSLIVNDSPDHLVVTVECEGLIVVHTANATLVCPMDRADAIKPMVEGLDEAWR